MWSAESKEVAEAELRLSGAAVSLLHELLHAMGQPLTVLQMCHVPGIAGGTAKDGREGLGEFAGQVDCLTELYQALRLLLEGSEEASDEVEIDAFVGRLHGGWQRHAARRSVRLHWETDAIGARILAGPRAECGLEQIVAAMLGELPAGATAEVRVRGDAAEVVLGPWQAGIEERGNWRLRVAGVLLESGGGRVVYGGQPMCARVQFARA